MLVCLKEAVDKLRKAATIAGGKAKLQYSVRRDLERIVLKYGVLHWKRQQTWDDGQDELQILPLPR
jgi:hypothetical protein